MRCGLEHSLAMGKKIFWTRKKKKPLNLGIVGVTQWETEGFSLGITQCGSIVRCGSSRAGYAG